MDDSRMASYLDRSAGGYNRLCRLCAADGILEIGRIDLFWRDDCGKTQRGAGDARFFDGRRNG